jgi:hypothetical protein
MIAFPSSPVANDTYTAGGRTWKYNGTVWQLQPTPVSYADLTNVPSTFAPTAHHHEIADVNGLQTALDGKQAAGSYATLVGGVVPASQLPSFVDDVVEFANLAEFPATGESGKLYVALDTGKAYRWSGSTYIEIVAAPGSTDAVPEGAVNKYYTDARAAAAAPVQKVAGRTGEVVIGISDVTDLQTALDAKQIKTVYADAAPAHAAGLEWVDTTELRAYRSYNNQWVEIDRA